jgi:hypothetical protein
MPDAYIANLGTDLKSVPDLSPICLAPDLASELAQHRAQDVADLIHVLALRDQRRRDKA